MTARKAPKKSAVKPTVKPAKKAVSKRRPAAAAAKKPAPRTRVVQMSMQEAAELRGQAAAISKAQAIIEFSLDGIVLHANDNFLNAVGYTLDEIRGKHHSIFVDEAYRGTIDYRLFWEKLRRGEYDAGQYKRNSKHGAEICLQASYNPIFDAEGRPFKVVKYATDVTAQVLAARALEEAVSETRHVVSAARDGDLRLRIDMDGKSGPIATLCEGVNSLVDAMAAMVSQLKSASGAINAAAQEISAGNADLSARTEQQAASLEETASSMEEMTTTVKQNAENASQANQLVINASDVARRGGEAMNGVVETMSGIQQYSRKVADIIGVIDGIAFQTNILALNAAVEAARAGEQGRGFAVVATEVRGLAQRSAAAAKEIKQLINDSVERVTSGGVLVDQAGKTMREIVTSIGKVTDIMGEITAASHEQGSGIEQISKAVMQMDESTQQNSALVEEMAASARNLESQAACLVTVVNTYRIDDAGEPLAVVPKAAVQPSAPPTAPSKGERRNYPTRPWSASPPPTPGRTRLHANGESPVSPAVAANGKDTWGRF